MAHFSRERQREILQGRIAEEFLRGLDQLGIGEAGIPDFRIMNDTLRAATGLGGRGRAGPRARPRLLPPSCRPQLPGGLLIRKPEQLDYIEEPDIFHDVFGHVPLIMQPVLPTTSGLWQGRASRRAERGALKAWRGSTGTRWSSGWRRRRTACASSAPASSPRRPRTIFALESPSPNRVAFDLGRVMRTRYRIDDFQETYFVLDGVEAWPRLDLDRLVPLWEGLESPTRSNRATSARGPRPRPRRRPLPPRQGRPENRRVSRTARVDSPGPFC